MEKKAFEEKTLDEIEKENHPELIAQYNNILEQMGTDPLAIETIERYYGNSIESIYHQIEKDRFDFITANTSEILFPGEVVKVYPGIKNPRAKKMITCNFSGARIYPGSFYVSYRPMVKNVENGKTYVLSKTMKVESGYEWDLPTTIAGLDALANKIQRAEYYDRIDGIDYTHLAQSFGDLNFQLLKRRKKVWK